MTNTKRYNFLYRTTNLINNKIYIGVHSTDDLDDGYIGSGKLLKRSIKKHGKCNFQREVLRFYDTPEEVYQIEQLIVNENFIKRGGNYNLTIGGKGGCNQSCFNMLVGKDMNGNILHIDKNDPRVLNGEVKSIMCDMINAFDNKGQSVFITTQEYYDDDYTTNNTGKIPVKDDNGVGSLVSVDDPRFLSGELHHVAKCNVTVKDDDGNIQSVSINDERYTSGELKHISKDMVVVKDNDGVKFSVSINDPRYLSGELVGHTKGSYNVKDKTGKIFNVSSDDPRIKSGELVGINKGKTISSGTIGTCPWCNKTGYMRGLGRNHFDYCVENPNRKYRKPHKKYEQSFISRECPHCGKIGKGGAMTIFHFDNCKDNPIN